MTGGLAGIAVMFADALGSSGVAQPAISLLVAYR